MGWRTRAARIRASNAAIATAATRAWALLLTVPASTVRPAAVSQRRSVKATRHQVASAQNRASEYTMDSAIEPGAAAHSAVVRRLTRRSPVSVMPSLVSPQAAARPAAIVTPRPAPIAPAPDTQATARMAAGYPGNQANMES
jgi:hypothetical protein